MMEPVFKSLYQRSLNWIANAMISWFLKFCATIFNTEKSETYTTENSCDEWWLHSAYNFIKISESEWKNNLKFESICVLENGSVNDLIIALAILDNVNLNDNETYIYFQSMMDPSLNTH